MAAVIGTKTVLTEFAGVSKVLHLTATLVSASDTITLTEATHGISVITGIIGINIKTGVAATFQSLSASFSGLVITVKSWREVATAAITWGDIELTLIGY